MSDKFEFDIAEFNKKFEQVMDERKKEADKENGTKLNKLSQEANENKKNPYNQTIGEILIGIKNTFFGILFDLFDGQFDVSILTKEHRMYYIGMIILSIVLIYSFMNILNQLYAL